MKTIFIFIINILLVGGGFIAPEKTIKNDIQHFYNGYCNIIDIIPLEAIEFEDYIDTLIFYNNVQKKKLIDSHKRGYWDGILEDNLYLNLVKNTKEKYNNIMSILIDIKSNKSFVKQTIHIYKVVYSSYGCENDLQIIELYLLNENNEPFGYICSDGNYMENPPDEGLICKTPEEFYNRNQKNINNYYIIK